MQTFLRRLAILAYLRATTTPQTSGQLLNHLRGSGYVDESTDGNTLLRLIQRDMTFLLGGKVQDAAGSPDESPDNDFGLQVTRGEGRTFLWSLTPYSRLEYDYEKMPQFLALAFSLTQKHLSNLLPRNTLAELERFFLQAENRLQKSERALSPQHLQRLTQAVEFYQRGQRLQAAEFDISHLDTIYRAIIQGRQLVMEYRGKDYRLHPLGVAILLPKLYLVARKDGDTATPEAYRSFLIHKIDSIYIDSRASQGDDTVTLKQWLDAGYMDMLVERQQRGVFKLVLELRVSEHSHLIEDLRESPVSEDQQLFQQAENRWQLEASVRKTIPLRNWILSLGASAKVIAPDEIREDVRSALKSMLSQYD
ncbi:MAG: WYL domain-containing protein [Hahellaceae bacterium]|nr:WYL domain-containing protein [Hahellaceae bacterium]MCP5169002.1 WYL domain-containing protein [Hahellaceae bacterium]